MSWIIVCPHCGNGFMDVMSDDTPDDWFTVNPHDHNALNCNRGCVLITRLYEEHYCDECGEGVGVFLEYWEPCDEQGHFSTRMVLKLDDVAEGMADGWMSGENITFDDTREEIPF